jgi:hypothetical protein
MTNTLRNRKKSVAPLQKELGAIEKGKLPSIELQRDFKLFETTGMDAPPFRQNA